MDVCNYLADVAPFTRESIKIPWNSVAADSGDMVLRTPRGRLQSTQRVESLDWNWPLGCAGNLISSGGPARSLLPKVL